ncbi:ATP-binding cassette domain-containing protein [uncultured Paracoccus sp.]|uniref:ATP-binding cassette domain-containing protein n=1 Tax=uncultured Paracoccus sp. TaxID=189685 RepID=UPI0026366E96|nr:ATP-binding cassette domain-containing protein [uncultured Paracoccus sp.]
MTLPLIDRESLGYGATVVLSGISFALAPGERVVLLGRSGAGKTTLLGTIHDRLVATGTRVALVPQDDALVPQLSVVKNTLMGRLDDHGALYNLTNLVRVRRADRAAILPILADVGLEPEAERPVEGLSGGQKQRTALARAFFRGTIRGTRCGAWRRGFSPPISPASRTSGGRSG